MRNTTNGDKNMRHPYDFTGIGNDFEQFCADHVPCPRCSASMDRLPPCKAVADLQCTQCDTYVNAKSTTGALNKTHPQSRKAIMSHFRLHGKRSLFFVIGSPEKYKIFQLGRRGVKELRSDRMRPYGKIQERVYFRFQGKPIKEYPPVDKATCAEA